MVALGERKLCYCTKLFSFLVFRFFPSLGEGLNSSRKKTLNILITLVLHLQIITNVSEPYRIIVYASIDTKGI